MRWKTAVAKALAPVLLTAGINACSDDSKNLAYQKAVTDFSGRVTFNDTPFTVKDDVNLEGITVHYLESDDHYLTLAVDGRGRHFPAVKGNSIDTVEYNLTQKPLLQELVIIMSLAYQGYKLYRSTQSPDRILLEETENINRYCISLEQMKNDYIDVPAGILSLAPAGDDAEEMEIAVTTPLKMLMENYVIHKYGEQEGYEVWVPKIDTSFCGRDYQGLVCPIDTQKLSQKLWDRTNAPIWKIIGPCSLDDTGEREASNETQERFNLVDNSNGTISDLRNSLQWFTNMAHELPFADAAAYCSGEHFDQRDWRLPTLEELEIYLLDEEVNSCYAPILFNGCQKSWYWSSQAFGPLTPAVSYQLGKTQGKDNSSFYDNGVKCVRRFL